MDAMIHVILFPDVELSAPPMLFFKSVAINSLLRTFLREFSCGFGALFLPRTIAPPIYPLELQSRDPWSLEKIKLNCWIDRYCQNHSQGEGIHIETRENIDISSSASCPLHCVLQVISKSFFNSALQQLVKAVAQTSRKTAESRRSAISMVIVTYTSDFLAEWRNRAQVTMA